MTSIGRFKNKKFKKHTNENMIIHPTNKAIFCLHQEEVVNKCVIVHPLLALNWNSMVPAANQNTYQIASVH
jgi:hypothetical protein